MDQSKEAKRNPLSCYICGQFYNSLTILTAHIEAHNSPKHCLHSERDTLPKKILDKNCSSESVLEKEPNTKFFANITVFDKEFLSENTPIKDVSSKNALGIRKKPTTKYIRHRVHCCEICNKSFTHVSSLRRHLLIHTKERPYECRICKKKFAQHNHLQRHNLVHSEDKRFSCRKCGKMFSYKTSLTYHQQTIHLGLKPFHCVFCLKTFVRTSDLKVHLLVHTKEKPFECHICKQKFSNNGNLQTHYVVHTGVKNFTCAVCGQQFAHKTSLTKHNASIHVEHKAFQCDVCSKTFSRADTLKIHGRYHTGEHTNICEVCGKSFVQSSHLRRHLKTHIKEKPFTISNLNETSMNSLKKQGQQINANTTVESAVNPTSIILKA